MPTIQINSCAIWSGANIPKKRRFLTLSGFAGLVFTMAILLFCVHTSSASQSANGDVAKSNAVTSSNVGKEDSTPILAAYQPALPEAGSTIEKKTKVENDRFDPALPNVLIIGDSISMGYTPIVRELLKGKANVMRPGYTTQKSINCEGTTAGIRNLDRWLGPSNWNVIHFNFGLHDLKRVKKPGDSAPSSDIRDPRQADLPTYEKNLENIVERLERTGAHLIFATTTPVPTNVAYVARTSEDVPAYNAAALRIMQRHHVTVDDLYSFALPCLAQIQKPRNVHFTTKGFQELGEQVARSIEAQLPRPNP